MARAGLLRKRVTFQTSLRLPDGLGGSTRTWGNDLTVWGEFVAERGQERLAAGRLQASAMGILTVRGSTETAAITTSHSVLIDGDRYQIRGIDNPDQKNAIFEFSVEQGVAT